jgi:hypothetical protein
VRPAALVVASLALAACQQDPPAQGARDPQAPLISAEGYGPVRVGMTVAEASAALGEALTDNGPEISDGCQTYHGSPESTALEGTYFMTQDGRIARVSTVSPAPSTAENIHVGSTDAEVRTAYTGVIEEPAHYDDPPAHSLIVWRTPNEAGIRFEINAEGVVTAIHAGNDAILLAEGCA